MSTTELKNKVISKLEGVDDQILKEILILIEFETDSDIYEVNAAERTAIEKGIEQIEEGQAFTNAEVENEIDLWLNK